MSATGVTISFCGRRAVLATMHGKEAAIAPPLAAAFGIELVVPTGFDSDAFGTFSREIPRAGSQREAARAKAQAGWAALGEAHTSLAIASEGSFGPHPSLPWATVNRELVVLIDRHHDLEIWGEALSWETQFQQRSLATWAEVEQFAAAVGFPDQGLIAMLGEVATGGQARVKGIRTWDHLQATWEDFHRRSPTGQVHWETDLRAMHNPSRMEVIAAAAADLVKQMQSRCPGCDRPGYGLSERLPGLRCAACGLPTPQPRADRYRCGGCGHQEDRPVAQLTTDPMYCQYCNP